MPGHLLVLGGGSLAWNSANFRPLGSRVTIVQRGPQLLGHEDKDVAEESPTSSAKTALKCCSTARQSRAGGPATPQSTQPCAGPTASAPHRHAPPGGGGPRARTVSTSTSRRPAFDSTTRLHPRQRTSGDQRHWHLCPRRRQWRPRLHAYLLRRLPHPPRESHRGRQREHQGAASSPTPSSSIHSSAASASAEQEARREGRNIRVAKMPMSYVARALEVDESRGFMKAIVDAESSQISAPHSWARRRRADGHAGDRDAGPSPLPRLREADLRPPYARGIAQQPLRHAGRVRSPIYCAQATVPKRAAVLP